MIKSEIPIFYCISIASDTCAVRGDDNGTFALRGGTDYLSERRERVQCDKVQGERLFRPCDGGGRYAGCTCGGSPFTGRLLEDRQ